MRLAGVRTASLVAAVALSAGCSGEAAPTPAPPPSKTASAPIQPTNTSSPTTTPTPPTLPEAAKGPGKKAAKAFVRHYIALINFAGTTGDVAQLRLLSDKRCSDCAELIRLFSRTYARGGYYETQGWKADALFVIKSAERTRYITTAEVETSKVRWRTSASAPETTAPGDIFQLRLELRSSGTSFSVMGMTRA